MTEPRTRSGIHLAYQRVPPDTVAGRRLLALYDESFNPEWETFAEAVAAIEAEARIGYVPAALSPEWHAELNMVAAEAVAGERARIAAAVEGLPATPLYGPVPNDGMCPNCMTPWTCNGPHVLPEMDPIGFDVSLAAVLSLLTEPEP